MQFCLKKILILFVYFIYCPQGLSIYSTTHPTPDKTANSVAIHQPKADEAEKSVVFEYDIYRNQRVAYIVLGCFGIVLAPLFLEIFDDLNDNRQLILGSLGVFIASIILIFYGAFLSKSYILCQKKQIITANEVIPIQDIQFVAIMLSDQNSYNIPNLQLYIKGNSTYYLIETSRMKGVMAFLKLLDFLRSMHIPINYSE